MAINNCFIKKDSRDFTGLTNDDNILYRADVYRVFISACLIIQIFHFRSEL